MKMSLFWTEAQKPGKKVSAVTNAANKKLGANAANGNGYAFFCMYSIKFLNSAWLVGHSTKPQISHLTVPTHSGTFASSRSHSPNFGLSIDCSTWYFELHTHSTENNIFGVLRCDRFHYGAGKPICETHNTRYTTRRATRYTWTTAPPKHYQGDEWIPSLPNTHAPPTSKSPSVSSWNVMASEGPAVACTGFLPECARSRSAMRHSQQLCFRTRSSMILQRKWLMSFLNKINLFARNYFSEISVYIRKWDWRRWNRFQK